MNRNTIPTIGTIIAMGGSIIGAAGICGMLAGHDVYDALVLPANQYTERTREFLSGEPYTQLVTTDELGQRTRMRPLTDEEISDRSSVYSISFGLILGGIVTAGIGLGTNYLGRQNRLPSNAQAA